MIFQKITGIAACLGSGAVVNSLSNHVQAKELVDCHECRMKRLPKARELSLYEKEEESYIVEYDEQSKKPLTSNVSQIRLQLSHVASYLNVFKQEAVHIYETGVAHSRSSYEYINSEENKIPRILTITCGGLVGILLARRGGYFKKAVYGSIGTGLVFSAFYPAKAKEYVSSGLGYTKQQTSDVLEKYGGYDTKKMAEDANDKVEYVKSMLKLEGLTKKLNELFYSNKEKVSKVLNNATSTSPNSKENEPGKSAN